MDRRRWPYDPHAPPRDERDDWVVVGDEPVHGYPQPEPPEGRYQPPYQEQSYQSSSGAYGPEAYPPEAYGQYEGRHNRDGYPQQPTSGYPQPARPYLPPPPDRSQPPPPARPYLPPVSGPAYPPPTPSPPTAWNPPAPAPYLSARDRVDPATAPGLAGFTPPRRRPDPTGGPRQVRPGPPRRAQPYPAPEPVDEDDPEVTPESPWQTVVAWTACFFLVPLLLYLGWALTRSGAAPSDCVNAAGSACLSPRATAVSRLVTIGPAVGGAFAMAMFASLGLRWLTATWRPSTVGFAAAVIGAGLATLVARIVGN